MLGVYLWSVLYVLKIPVSSTEDPGMFLCDTLIDGDVCNKKGMAAYITYDDPPTRPSTFYPISFTSWYFNEANVLNYLGVSSSEAPSITAKFSGVFTAPESGRYVFNLVAQHTISDGQCYFSVPVRASSLFLEPDLSYSGTGTDHGAMGWLHKTLECTDYGKFTNYAEITKDITLVAGEKYPLFAGIRYNWTVPITQNLYLYLGYKAPGDSTYLTIESEATAGLTGYSVTTSSGSSGDSSASDDSASGGSASDSSASNDYASDGSSVDSVSGVNNSLTLKGSNKVNYDLIGGVFAGVIVVVVVVAIVFWVIFRRMSKKGEPSGSGPIDHRKDSERSGLRRKSDMDVEVGGGTLRRLDGSDRVSTRAGSVRSGRMGSGLSGSAGGGHSSHANSAHRGRLSSGRSSRDDKGLRSRTPDRYVRRVGN